MTTAPTYPPISNGRPVRAYVLDLLDGRTVRVAATTEFRRVGDKMFAVIDGEEVGVWRETVER